jgi:hypothetical protein
MHTSSAGRKSGIGNDGPVRFGFGLNVLRVCDCLATDLYKNEEIIGDFSSS